MAMPVLQRGTVEQLAVTLRGALIQQRDEGYDAARRVCNTMTDERPLLIARCADIADVVAAGNSARETRLDLAVRSGSHNGAGLGSVDDGLVIDLSPMKGMLVDPAARTVRV
jgi:FAD/FMN-containing dehydrogenase